MTNNIKCNICDNKEQCKNCNKEWLDKFIPTKENKKYFTSYYNGVRGYDGKHSYHFNTTDSFIKSTSSFEIGYKHVCPYCGFTMLPLQDKETYINIGYRCFCDGSKNELEYKQKLKELEIRHKSELEKLNNQYIEKLKYNSNKLFEMKQKNEKEKFEFFSRDKGFLTTINGEKSQI